jgi:hypothetical protein
MTRSSEIFRRILGASVVALSLTGCTTRVADLTLVSTKNIDFATAKLDARSGQRVKGEDCVVWILGLFPVPARLPNLEEAVDMALERGQGSMMIDQVTYVRNLWFLLAAQQCILVEGTVLSVAASAAPPPSPPQPAAPTPPGP